MERINRFDGMRAIDKIDKTIVLTGTKAQAVELWRTTRGHISNICRAVGISRQTYYDWLKEDPLFAQAIADAEAELNDDMREALIAKGADGSSSDIQFYLKARHPDFKPQPTVQVNTQQNFYEKASEQANRFVVEVKDAED